MKTNIEQFRYYEGVRDGIARARVISLFGHVPKSLWKLGPKGPGFEPEEWHVEYVRGPFPPGAHFNKQPSKQQVSDVKAVADGDIADKDITLHVVLANPRSGMGRHTTGCRLTSIGEDWRLCRDFLLARQKELSDLYIAKEGQFNCRYCGKATDIGGKLRRAVIARQYPNMRAEFDYCSEQCASYDQMAHEG